MTAVRARWPLAALAALLLACTWLSVHAVNRDTVPMAADAAGYYRTTLTLDRLLEQGRTREALARLLQAEVRPPLPQLVTVATYRLLGERSQRVARLSILPFLWLLLLATYGLGARLKDRETGVVAAALLAGFPQVIGFSRSYWMDLPLAAVTALSLWALLSSDGLRRRGTALLFGLTLGLGLLTKYTFPVFVGGPALYLALRGLRQAHGRRARRLRVENICLALLVTAALAAFWYVPSLDSAWRNFRFNQGTDLLRPRPLWTLENLLLYLRHLPVQLGPWLVALLGSAPLFLLLAPSPARLLVALWLGLPYLFFTFFVLGIEWARFTLPYLPALALVIALALMLPRRHRALRALGHALALASLLGAVFLTLGPPPPLPRGAFPWQRAQARGLLAPQGFDVRLCPARLLPPRGAGWTHVALAPDVGTLASVLETLALEQGAPLRVSVPYEPEAFGFRGRFAFPRRLSDPRYLRAFDYLVWVEPPEGIHPVPRRPDLYRRFLLTWQAVAPTLRPTARVRLPGGYVLQVLRPDEG